MSASSWMPGRDTGVSSRFSAAARAVLRLLFGPPAKWAFGVRYWDGTSEGPAGATTVLHLNRAGALRRMLWPPSDLSVAESYLFGDLDIEGDPLPLLTQGVAAAPRLLHPLTLLRLLPRLLSLPTDDAPPRPSHAATHEGGVHSKERDARSIRYHYDVGNDFYALFLDQRMVYSCAYFATGQETLEEAQRLKLDRLCRKLRLKPGEHLLDIGSGWGALSIYAAQHYGVRVTGITLSPAQAELARARAQAAGVADRVTFELRDYRDLPPVPSFDKIVSVGMVEHVGSGKLPAYFQQAYRLLRPGGLFLNHGIVTAVTPRFVRWGFGLMERYLNSHSFIQEYVFPDGELRRIGELTARAEAAGFELRDVENMREHYALTLLEWIRRLEANHDQVVRLTDEVTYRIWRLYMAGSADSFRAGRIGVVQSLYAKPTSSGKAGLPLSRVDVEAGTPSAAD
ncbi:cyclopropane-fatty-acyl-phospholipid synthase family protein [Deinococcus sp. KNUC1210]|uniref:SAM-dependent methyltransferase n=1 Tax=Deinococcus sp. KNUC1210 TaxID=2917691 RepID=UPI001EF0573B|nr:cyclopropane-fatty-acyl-phospholipid synthase family protein [Deinococcus sp. KNUC1210]ULH14555.1 cyclopropane-fatty-acyl-phospholipid synthase family protein [Deinococcus sp. KNUC1210]